MNENLFEALFYLTSGVFLFVIIFLFLRLQSIAANNKNLPIQFDEKWIGFEELVIQNIIDEAANIKTFVLRRLDQKKMPNFRAGQFLSFQIDNSENLVRSYSISSSPNTSSFIQVSIKQLKDGKGSTWFHSLKVGDKVKASLPSGHFVDEEQDDRTRVYIAGGVGITPILSMIQKNLENATQFKMILFYGARTHADLAFHDLFLFWSKRQKNFHYKFFLSEDSNSAKLDYASLKNEIDNLADCRFFLCGPSGLTDSMIEKLIESGVDETLILNEKFVSTAEFDESKLPIRKVNIEFNGQILEYNGQQNILDFLEARGESLPFACRSGVCGSCKCKIEGQFKMLTNAGLTRSEQKLGLALACVAYPESNIKIQTVD